MPFNKTEWLALVHQQASASEHMSTQLQAKVAEVGAEGDLTVPATVAISIASMLEHQTWMIKKLVEHGEEIDDLLDQHMKHYQKDPE